MENIMQNIHDNQLDSIEEIIATSRNYINLKVYKTSANILAQAPKIHTIEVSRGSTFDYFFNLSVNGSVSVFNATYLEYEYLTLTSKSLSSFCAMTIIPCTLSLFESGACRAGDWCS